MHLLGMSVKRMSGIIKLLVIIFFIFEGFGSRKKDTYLGVKNNINSCNYYIAKHFFSSWIY